MSESLRGQVLIAARHMKDPNFWRTVVLIVEQTKAGAMGLVLNRPTVTMVREALEGHFDLPEATAPVFTGGPVEPSALFLLHDSAAHAGEDLPVLPGLFVGGNAQVFGDVVTTAAIQDTRYRVFRGCAGWGPDQLPGELRRGDWHTLPASEQTVFDENLYDLWERLIETVSGRHPLFPENGIDHRMN